MTDVNIEPMPFLDKEGKRIFKEIVEHCQKNKVLAEIDQLELSMLANAYATYFKYAALCNKNGHTQKPKDGGWDQVRPEWTIMRNEYQNILKHSPKFGLNPGDRAKLGFKAPKRKLNLS